VQQPPSNEKWDKRFLQLAAHVAGWSKDPSTQVGAVIADGKHVVSVGYNGFPESTEDKDEWLNDRPTKYSMVIHAEANAIFNARQYVRGLTLYVSPLSPCLECAKLIAGAGFSRVVWETKATSSLVSIEQVKKIFDRNNISYQEY
jgi:dCMP deaminase